MPECANARTTFPRDPEYLIDTWETEDGLPENSATSMVQTPDGYLWFGTFNGLVRFDGVKFTVFNPANTPQLPSAGVVNLHLDRRGWLWISTYRGLTVRDGNQWRAFGKNEGWTGDLVRTFAERDNGDLLLTSFDGRVLQFSEGRLTELPVPGGRKGVGYFGFAGHAGEWWVVQQWFVGSWDGQRWVETEAATNLYSEIVGAGATRDGNLWLKAGPALHELRRGNRNARIALPDRPGTPWSITEDRHGNVWMATYDHGLSRVSPSGEIRYWTTTNGLSYQGTRFVFEDREGNLWVGTSGGGLQRFKPRRFQSYGAESGLTERHVTSVSPDANGNVWLATYSRGVFRWNNGSITQVPLPPSGNTLNVVNSVLNDRAGRTWFGTWGQGVCVMDSNGFRRIPIALTSGFNILALFEDSRGGIWAGSQSGVSVCEDQTFRLVQDASAKSLAGVRCFAEDASGAIWMSNLEGVFRFDNDRFIELREAGEVLRDISCIKADGDGTIWLGAVRGDLLCRRGERLSRIDLGTDAGVHGIVEDDAGFFWIASNRGVLLVTRESLLAAADGKIDRPPCLVFDLNDGLPSVECAGSRQPVCARDAQGRLWFATLKGPAMIDPARLRLNTNPPPVQIESIVYRVPRRRPRTSGLIRAQAGGPSQVVADDLAFHARMPFSESLQLPAGSSQIEIFYPALSFTTPEKVRFQIKLEGQDTDWQEAGAHRRAYYHELSPGPHLFRVRAANDDGLWNESGVSLAFAVKPFVWQTLWFRGALLLFLVASGGGAVWLWARAKLRRALEQERIARELQDSRQRMDLAADAASLGLWVWDIPKNHIWATDKCKNLYGYPADGDLSYEALLVRVHPEDRDPTERVIATALAGQGRYDTQYRVLRPDGAVCWMAASGRVERDPAGKPVRMLGISIDITERKRAEEAARALSGRLINAQEDERRRLARDLHDDLNQRLALLSVEMELLRRGDTSGADDLTPAMRLEEMAARVKELSSEVHKLSYQLHPAKLDQLGLESAARSFCRDLSRQSGVRIDFAAREVPHDIASEVALCFYRVIQETLQNVVKHSGAKSARVELDCRDETLCAVVTDSGKGFDVEQARRTGGLGLVSIEERIRLVQGKIFLSSKSGEGTRVELSAPLRSS